MNSSLTISIPTSSSNGLSKYFDLQLSHLEKLGTDRLSSKSRRRLTGPALATLSLISISPLFGLPVAAAVGAGILATLTGPALNYRRLLSRWGTLPSYSDDGTRFLAPSVEDAADDFYSQLNNDQKAMWLLCNPDYLRTPMLSLLKGLNEVEQSSRLRTCRTLLIEQFPSVVDSPEFAFANTGTSEFIALFESVVSNTVLTLKDAVTHVQRDVQMLTDDIIEAEIVTKNSFSIPDSMPSNLHHKFEALASQGFPIHLLLDSAVVIFAGDSQSGKTTFCSMVQAMRMACGYDCHYISCDECIPLPWSSCITSGAKNAIAALAALADEVAAAPDHSWSGRAYVVDEMWRLTDESGDVASEALSRILQKGNKTDACFSVITQNLTTEGTGARGKSKAFNGSAFKVEAHQSIDSTGRARATGRYTLTYPDKFSMEPVTFNTPSFILDSSNPVKAFCEFIGLDCSASPVSTPETASSEVQGVNAPVLPLDVRDALKTAPEGLSYSKLRKQCRSVKTSADVLALVDAGLLQVHPGAGYNSSDLYSL